MDIGIKLLPVMWVFLCIYKIHPLFMKYSNGTSTQCHAYQYRSLFPVLFLQSLYVPFYEFFHLLVSTLFLLVFMFITRSFLANLKLNY